jgi:hypothetical protein
MTPEVFESLFTREALRPFQPRPGTIGLTPMLEVYTPGEVLVFVLAFDNFNDWEARCGYLRALGMACHQKAYQVTACRFGSEAWMRSFTQTEYAARGERLVESYPDREECIVVMGETVNGVLRFAQAPLRRRPDGKIEGLGMWKVTEPDVRARSPLLKAFWEGYSPEAFYAS